MNTENKPAPRPHAELIKAWADGAKIQFKNTKMEWKDWTVDYSPMWNPEDEFRIKPEEPSNEPWKPKENEDFWLVGYEGCVYFSGSLPNLNRKAVANGNCFRTKDEAQAAAERVKAALKGTTDVSANVGSVPDTNVGNIGKDMDIPTIDGKPLSDGETALIKALRCCSGLDTVFNSGETLLIETDKDHKALHALRYHIAFQTIAGMETDRKIIAALNQIKAEQKAI